jgi:hypothetical protein
VSAASKGHDPLLSDLGALLARLDPMPPELLEQVRRLYCWRSIDAELAELSYDSLLDRDALLAVRSVDDSVLEPRMLGFGAVVGGADLAIEVEVSSVGGQCTMLGQLAPPGARTIGLQADDGEVVEADVDELGRFRVHPVPRGPVRLQVTHSGCVVRTTWVSFAS